MRTSVRGYVAIGLMGAVLFGGTGCGDDADGAEGPGPTAGQSGGTPCVAGTSYSCFGAGACAGTRLCRDGFLTSCICQGPGPAADASAADAARPADAATPDASAPDAAAQAGSGGARAGSGGGPAPVSEDCSNGTDDDGDGDSDCRDSDCGARACVAAPASGWEGPVLLHEDGDASSCAARYPDEVLRGGTAASADPAVCSCTCTPSGAGCATFLNVNTGTSSSCDALACTTSLNASCVELAPACLAGLATGYLQTQAPVGPANCTAAAGAPDLPAVEWDDAALGCAPEAALERDGCDDDELCAPEPEGDGTLCIYRAGEHACPGDDYDDRRVYFTEVDDTRGCSPCSCGNDCNYEWKLYAASDTSCAAPVLTIASANQCVAVNPTDGKLRVGVEIEPCAKSGGVAQGAVAAGGAVTVCCLQN